MKRSLKVAGVLLVFVAIATGGALAVVALNLRSYARLTYEQPVAQLDFEAQGPQRYRATVTRLPSHEKQVFDLAGDEWQVDARVLKWHGWANVLGLDARYRLERVSGRYTDVEQERSAPRSVYALSDTPAIDFWSLAKTHPTWFWFIDGFYGSATYLPMAAGAQYEVVLTQSGLIARPTNAAAQAADTSWQ